MALDEIAAALALEDWVKEVLGEDLKATYPHVTAAKADLPDAQVDVRDKSIQMGGDQRFPWGELQNRLLRVFEVAISFMVAKEDGLEADAESTLELRDFGRRMEAALLSQPTLNDRVQMASPICNFDYALPFVEYPDGTRGRQMMMNMAVAELVDYEE